MRATSTTRLIIDKRPERGSWNMSVDETLLDSAVGSQLCTVRVYRWSEPTLSLGYFQERLSAATSTPLATLPTVRRLSGGGAVLHHHELTYSCCVPAAHPLARIPARIYEQVAEHINRLLIRRGYKTQLRGALASRHDDPFLCFGRGDPYDIVCGRHKILGSAQRRRRGAILQHGSLLLSRSEHAPEYPGLRDLSPAELCDQQLAEELAACLGTLFGRRVRHGELSEHERQLAHNIERLRYETPGWTHRRTRAGRAAVGSADRNGV